MSSEDTTLKLSTSDALNSLSKQIKDSLENLKTAVNSIPISNTLTESQEEFEKRAVKFYWDKINPIVKINIESAYAEKDQALKNRYSKEFH